MGTKDHDLLSGLSDDDHTQYALLAGRSGGQILIGGTASGNDLTLRSTSHGTKGSVILDENGGKTTLELSDTTANVGLTIGSDTNLYRRASSELGTDDLFTAVGGITLGSELTTNGTFTGNANNWTLNSPWTYGTNRANHDSNGTGGLVSDATITAGYDYVLTYDVANYTAGSVTPSCGGNSLKAKSANGSYTERFYATSTAALTFTASNGARLAIDTVSLKRVVTGGIRATGNLSVDGTIYLPATSSESAGLMYIGRNRVHGFGGSQVGNLFIGNNAGNFTNSTVGYNVGIGADALQNLTTGLGNMAIGAGSLQALTTGLNNVGIATSALFLLQTGSNNVAIGGTAGFIAAGATDLANNTYLGYEAAPGGTGTYTGQVAIGYQAKTTGNNSVAIGTGAVSTAANLIVFGTTAEKVFIPGTELELDGALNHDGTTVGFYGVAPATRPTAYTQTYSTADKTHANFTSADIGAFTGGLVGFLDAAERDNIRTQFNALRADLADAKQVINSIIDDLQSLGILQ